MGDQQSTVNERLAAAMKAHGLCQAELAEELNRAMGDFTGKPGTLSDRHVRRWLTGHSTWPHARQRRALEAVFGCTAQELGFAPRTTIAPEVEVPVHRRAFVTSTAAAAAGARTPGSASGSTRYAIGMGDVERLRQRLDALAEEDNRRGSGAGLERRAVALARYTIGLQAQGSASQRVRRHLYAMASEFAMWGMWAAIDGREPERAQVHMDRAVTLASMSGDSATLWRAWNQGSMTAVQLRLHADALAMAEAARGCAVVRRDPLRASLTHARVADAQARLGERTAASRTLGHAWAALDRWDGLEAPPTWLAFYDAAELSGLEGAIQLRLGDAERAEACAHRTLSLLRPEFERNRVYYTVLLARAQAAQGEVGLACATADTMLADGVPLPGRIRKSLATFHSEVSTMAPDASEVHEWEARLREKLVREAVPS